MSTSRQSLENLKAKRVTTTDCARSRPLVGKRSEKPQWSQFKSNAPTENASLSDRVCGGKGIH